METLAALGLAANIAQLLGVAGKAVEKTRELALSKKTLLEQNEELDSIVSDFKTVVPMLRDNGDGMHDAANAELKKVAEDTKTLCTDIKARLDGIQERRAKKRHREKLYVTWNVLGLKDVFRVLTGRLSELRNQISWHINIVLL